MTGGIKHLRPLRPDRSDDQGSDDRGSDDRGSDDRGSDVRGSDDRGSDDRGSDVRGSDVRGSDVRGSDVRGSDDRGSDVRGSDVRGSDDRGSDDRTGRGTDRDRARDIDETSIPPIGTDALAAATQRAEEHDVGSGKTSLRRGVTRVDERANVFGSVARIALLLLVATLASLLLAPRLVRADLPDDKALVGTPARSFVKADRDYALVDSELTSQLRDAASLRSPSVWDLDTALVHKDAQVLHKGLVRLAVALEPIRATARELPPALVAAEPVRAVLAGELALVGVESPRDDVWRALVKAIWTSPHLIDAVQARVLEALAEPVVVDPALLAREVSRVAAGSMVAGAAVEWAGGIVVRALPARLGGEQMRNTDGILDVAAARARAAERIRELFAERSAGGILDKSELSGTEAAALADYIVRVVRATLTFNAAESDQRRRNAAQSVPPVIVRAHRGEIVLRPGEVITQKHQLLIVAMKIQQADDMRRRAQLGTGFFVGLLCLVVYLFGARRVFRRTLRTKDLAFLALLELLVLLCIVAADAAAPLLQSAFLGIPASAVFFAVPVAFGAMTARLTLPPDVALLFSLVTALLGGVVVEPGMSWSVVAVVTSLTGAAGVSQSHRRSTMLLAGVGAGLVGAFAALTLELFRGALVGQELLWLLGAVVASGALSGLLVIVVTPVVERLFGYVTEQRLYKLADLNHPLLKDLVVHAPGTWHHSIRTAELAEAAARSVGASAILARVMALFHDVGKMKQPRLFSENQTGDNPHERMSPEQSAKVLRDHVQEGVALALAHGLPRAVVAAIEEHHVDNLMAGFFDRARSTAEGGTPINAAAFRYRGRPPATRESALTMLADQIEAAARNLSEPSPERLCELVDGLVNRAITEDTLADCDLSLRDLGRARAALQGALLKLYPQEGRPS